MTGRPQLSSHKNSIKQQCSYILFFIIFFFAYYLISEGEQWRIKLKESLDDKYSNAIDQVWTIGVSKAALESITRYMAYDLAPKGINVNSISASLLETDAIQHFPNQSEIKKILNRKNPTQKKLLTDHIAKAAIMLCTEESEMIIGQNILVDGGDTLLLS